MPASTSDSTMMGSVRSAPAAAEATMSKAVSLDRTRQPVEFHPAAGDVSRIVVIVIVFWDVEGHDGVVGIHCPGQQVSVAEQVQGGLIDARSIEVCHLSALPRAC